VLASELLKRYQMNLLWLAPKLVIVEHCVGANRAKPAAVSEPDKNEVYSPLHSVRCCEGFC
jgi:hypothetical protein